MEHLLLLSAAREIYRQAPEEPVLSSTAGFGSFLVKSHHVDFKSGDFKGLSSSETQPCWTLRSRLGSLPCPVWTWDPSPPSSAFLWKLQSLQVFYRLLLLSPGDATVPLTLKLWTLPLVQFLGTPRVFARLCCVSLVLIFSLNIVNSFFHYQKVKPYTKTLLRMTVLYCTLRLCGVNTGCLAADKKTAEGIVKTAERLSCFPSLQEQARFVKNQKHHGGYYPSWPLSAPTVTSGRRCRASKSRTFRFSKSFSFFHLPYILWVTTDAYLVLLSWVNVFYLEWILIIYVF